MASIGSTSVLHIASSLARSIADSQSTSASTAQISPGTTVPETIKSAFDRLIKTQQNDAARPDSGVASIEPFSAPPVPIEGLMPSLKEAIGAFRELAGAKQKWSMDALDQARSPESGIQTSGPDQQLAQLFDKQRATGPAPQQLAQLSDMQRATGPAPQQLAQLSDMQRATGPAPQQLAQLSDMQRATGPAPQQLAQLSDKQRATGPAPQQLAQLSDMQRATGPVPQQLAQLSDMQKAPNLGQQQLASQFDQQRPHGDPQPASPAVKMLDQCGKLFGLLDQIVAGDKDLALKSNQMIR